MQALQLRELQTQYSGAKRRLKEQLAEAEASLLAPHRGGMLAVQVKSPIIFACLGPLVFAPCQHNTVRPNQGLLVMPGFLFR